MENVSASPGKPKILVVSRDAHLTEVRTTLETAGFQVFAGQNLREIKVACESGVRLIMVGQSLSPNEKRRVWKMIQEVCKAPVLELYESGGPVLMDALFFHESHGDDFLEKVREIVTHLDSPVIQSIPIRILVVDDHEVIRRGVRTLLGSLPELEVIGEAAGGLEALKLAEELLPDVIVLDISMPDMNGLDVARRLRQVTPKSRILFMSQHSSAQVVQEALRTGACGYILKSDAASDLVSGVKSVSRGDQFVSTSLVAEDAAVAHWKSVVWNPDNPIYTRSFVPGVIPGVSSATRK